MAPRSPQISGRSAASEHSLLRPPHIFHTLVLASAVLGAALILRGAVESGVASAILRQLLAAGQLRQQQQQQPPPYQQVLQEGVPAGVLPSKLSQGGHPQAAAPPQPPSALQERHQRFQPLFLADLWVRLEVASKAHPYRQCRPGRVHLNMSSAQALTYLHGKAAPAKQVLQGYATSLPCEMYTCCDVLSYFRTGSRDFDIFQQVFEQYQMRYLFPVSDKFRPKYILDAGGNAGFSTLLFKLIWPEAIVVTLEPDASNFGMLERNNNRFSRLHLWNAGLWGHQAKIGLLTDEAGSWGLIFKEVPPTTPGAIEAYSVKDIMQLLNITAFDLIKIDVEGAEGKVFAPGEDVSWLDSTQLVIMETHDRMANRFGLEEVSSRVADAFIKSSAKFRAIDDSEHVFLVSKSLADQLLA